GEDKYYGRDALFGSSSLARKVETVVLISLTDREDGNSPREYSVMPRNGRAEKFYLQWEPSAGLTQCEKPDPRPEKEPPAMAAMRQRCMSKFKRGEQVIYSSELGAET